MSLEHRVAELAAEVEPVDERVAQAARERHARLAKPPGSLGELEELGARLSAIAGCCPPRVPERPAAVVAAGDHGVLAQGVSPWPAEITALMVGQFCAGRGAVNALAGVVGAQVTVLDVGVAGELPRHPRLRAAKVRRGTADLSAAPAMEREEAARALLAGAGLAEELVGAGVDLLVAGDMGIGNTTPAACLVAAFTGLPAERVTGPGATADPSPPASKVETVARALERHGPGPADPLGALAAVGGLEHAALAGLVVGAASERVPLVLDGVSTVAAALAAVALCPLAADYLVASHRSPEPGAGAGLDHLGLRPLLSLGMRLGEATGGLLAVPIVRSAAAALAEMATLEEVAGVRAALAFLTVLPVGGRHAAPGRAALLAFPLAGLTLGAGWVAAAWAGTTLWTPLVGAALLLAVDLAATGAMHADAVADVADGLASRRPRAEALQIMRTPEVGAVGAGTAFVALLLRLAFATALATGGLWALLVVIPALSRAAMVVALAAGERSTEPSLAGALAEEATPPVAAGALALAGAAAALAGAGAGGWPGAALAAGATAAVAAVALLAARAWRHRFGALTGDAAGAAGMAAELVALAVLSLAATQPLG